MHYLMFDLSEGSDDVATLEAMASTRADAHAAVLAEVQQVLDWAERHFPGQHGPAEDGQTWNHELLLQQEAGGWHTVTLTLTGTRHFAEALLAAFDGPPDPERGRQTS